MQIWSVTNDVGPSVTRWSPWRPRVASQLTSFSSAVITLVGSLRLIILDFGMHRHCLHLLASHTAAVQIERADNTEASDHANHTHAVYCVACVFFFLVGSCVQIEDSTVVFVLMFNLPMIRLCQQAL